VGAPIPIRLREAIVRARAEEFSYEEIAAMLDVGRATVNRVLRRQRETGSVEPSPPRGGWVSPIHGRLADLLRAIIATMPDATVAELTEALMKRGEVATSRSAVQRALGRLGYSRKKRASSPSSATRRSTARAGARSARS
jgi:transposase